MTLNKSKHLAWIIVSNDGKSYWGRQGFAPLVSPLILAQIPCWPDYESARRVCLALRNASGNCGKPALLRLP